MNYDVKYIPNLKRISKSIFWVKITKFRIFYLIYDNFIVLNYCLGLSMTPVILLIYFRSLITFQMDCPHCTKPYKHAKDCYQHIRRVHGVEPLETRQNDAPTEASNLIKCTHCPKSFKYAKNCYAHIRKAHGVDPMQQKKKDKENMQPATFNFARDIERKVFECKECTKVFSSRENRDVHEATH